MSKVPVAIEVEGRLYKLAKRFREDWESEYVDPAPPPAGVKVPSYDYKHDDSEAREFYQRMEMKENDVRWRALQPLFHSLLNEAFDRVIAHMNSGELTEDIQQQLKEKLDGLDIAVSMFDPWSRMDPTWILARLDDVETLTRDPDVLKFKDVEGLSPAGPIKLHDIVKEIDKEGHLKNLGFTLGVDDETHRNAHKRGAAAPAAIKVNGTVYRRADGGPEAPADDPEPMSNEAVLAADFGVPPSHVENLKGFKNESGTSLYDIIQKSLGSD